MSMFEVEGLINWDHADSLRAIGYYNERQYDGLIVKRSFWRWPQRGTQGNVIDLFVNVLGLSFNDAMRQIVTEDIAEIYAAIKHNYG